MLFQSVTRVGKYIDMEIKRWMKMGKCSILLPIVYVCCSSIFFWSLLNIILPLYFGLILIMRLNEG